MRPVPEPPRARVLLLGDTRLVGHHGSAAVVAVILEQLARRGIDAISSIARPDFVRNIPALKANAIDGIVINAEGALHGRNKHALLIADAAKKAKSASIPCIILNAVLDDCDPDVIAGIRQATRLFCREGRSKALADFLGIPAEFCPDLTFALDLGGRTWVPGDRIIVTDSTLAETNYLLHAFARRHRFRYLPLRGRPTVVSAADPQSLFRRAKFDVRNRLGRWLPGSFQVDRFGQAIATLEGFLDELADHTRIVVSGRFHGVCLCLKLGVPFVAVRSNTHKVEGLLEDCGLADRLIGLDALSVSEGSLGERLAAAGWTAADEHKRDCYVEQAQTLIARCFDHVAAAVSPELAHIESVASTDGSPPIQDVP